MCVSFGNPKFVKTKGYLKGARLNIPKDYSGRYRVYPGGDAPIARIDKDGLRVDMSQFQLIPDFSDSRKPKYSTLNARDDKLFKSRMWRPIFEKNQRCLIPLNYFFEPHTLSEKQVVEGKDKLTNKVPFKIWLKSAEQFYFAGLWNEWTDKQTGEVVLSHAIITTDANDTLAKIHNAKKRMPVILPETALDQWLDTAESAKDLYDSGLLSPWPDEDIKYCQITKAFDYGAGGEEVSRPVEQPIEIQ